MFSHQLTADAELRLFNVQHAEELYALIDSNREHLRRWLPWVDGTSSVEMIKTFRRRGLQRFAEDGSFDAGIWYQGQIAGVIGIHAIDWTHRKTSIGYWLGEQYQGKGLMTMSCRAVLQHLFGTLQLNRVEICAAVENHRSRAVPERLGFRHEATLRQVEQLPSGFVDHVVYAMLREEWEVGK